MRAAFVFALLVSVSGAALAEDNDVVITASPLASEKFATSVQSVSRDDILTKGGASLSTALAEVPGVANTGFAAGASRPVIRGMDANRVKLLEDGASSADVSDIGPDHGVPIDPLAAQKIEVVRGPATLRYGGQAIGGVVNAINNRIPLALPDKPVGGEASAAFDTTADTIEGAAMLDGRVGQFALHADAFGRTAENYDTPLGVQRNSFFHGSGYSFGSSYFLPDQDRVGVALVHYDARYGIPSDTTYIDMRQTKALGSATAHIDSGPMQTLNVNLSYADYIHDEKDPDGTIESTFVNREFDGRAELLFGKIGRLSSSALGVQAVNRDFSAGGEGGDYLFPTNTHGVAAFAFTEAPLGARANLQAAARVEHTEITGTPASDERTTRRFAPFSVSVGAVWDPTDAIKLGVTFASAARAPAQTELFARGPHDGPGTFEAGDPTLGIERANSLEATARVRARRWRFDGAVWAARFDNYIYGRLTGRTCEDNGTCFADDAHDLKELIYTSADAHFWGAEGKASYDLFKIGGGALELDALADMVRADLTEGGGPVPRIPPYRAGGGLSWAGGGIDAGFLMLHVGAQDRVPAGDTTTPSYRSLNAHVSWKPRAFAKGLELALVGENLTEDVQRNAVALNREDVVAPGRNIRFVLRRSF